MLYLLDADTLITGDREAYPLKRFKTFWTWLCHQGNLGNVKIPLEQYEEITEGQGALVDWLKQTDIKQALLLNEDADPVLVDHVIQRGYGNLTEDEIERVGRDPFLIAYATAAVGQRTIVSFERSMPAKQRANRKVPDVCLTFGVPCIKLFDMIRALDFTTDWQPP